MISKVLKLKNVGLLQNAIQGFPVTLAKVTAIYAENGRGKTTLAAVLRSCQLGDTGRLNARTTIDETNMPEVDFLLPAGNHVEFKGNAWTTTLPDIIVFDSEFVEQNIYSGCEVRADQRQSLLEFALGDQTVQLKQQIDQLTKDIDTQTQKRSQAEKILAAIAKPYTFSEFINIQPITDAQRQIDEINKRIEAAKNIHQLGTRQDPVELSLLQFDIVSVFEILNTQLQNVEQAAESLVKEHINKIGFKDIEDWLSSGQKYTGGAGCPFCGQEIRDLELIKAYRSYFNDTYGDLKEKVANLLASVKEELADSKIEVIVSKTKINTARIDAWKDQINIAAPSFDCEALFKKIKQAREQLLTLVELKQKAPLELVGSQADNDTVKTSIDSINLTITDYNSNIRAITKTISEFKKTLAAEDIAKLKDELTKLEAAKKSGLPEVIKAIADYKSAEIERKRLDGEKTTARKQLDNLMEKTLQQYQASINELLIKFGAEFSIEKLKPTYQGGGEPRTEYGLRVRNKSVKLGSRADMVKEHTFATTLSEADKRTLAFAFFIARLNTDQNLGQKLIVLDDPVSSLDRNRRHNSIRLITNLSDKCCQMLVLSHDPYFIRDIREQLADNKTTPINPNIIAIKRIQSGYSAFASCDIDDVCSSDYYRHHRVVADYVDGKSTTNSREVATAIRPLLEGYYHRRFPRRIPRKQMFGQIINLIASTQPGDPLAYLRPIINELKEVNDYAGQFHHDTNPSYETAPFAEVELLGFATRALDLIYKNG
jgi:wobble nucleotide-excising tRNase